MDSGIYGAALTPNGQSLVYDYIAGNGGELFDEEGNCVVNSCLLYTSTPPAN